jgi:multiple sugar transport system substrate-binding protein
MFKPTSRRVAVAATAAAAALALTACSGGAAAPSETEGPATINLTWWGNDDRAARFEEAIDLFEKANPTITVNGTFTDYPSYWEKRQTEAAGGGLPDVMLMDWQYLRQYGENGLLLSLNPYLESTIATDAIDQKMLDTCTLDGETFAAPIGYSSWGVFQNEDLLTSLGAEAYEGGTTWQEYSDYIASVTELGGGEVYGGLDYTQRIQNFELQLRQDGKNLFNEDGELDFTKEELAAYWESGADLRAGGAVPQSKLEEVYPVTGFGASMETSEPNWTNILTGFYADSGAKSITMVPPPTDKPAAKDLYQKVSLMYSQSANTKHADAGAKLIDFLVNSPEVGAIFGTTLGIPASQTQLDGVDLAGPDQTALDYMETIEDRLGDAPPAPVAGFGAIEQTFWDLGKGIGLGSISVDDAVNQFFDEVEQVLAASS